MSRSKKIVLLMLAVALVAGIYAGVRAAFPTEKDSTDAAVTVCNIKQDFVTGIEWINTTDKIKIELDGYGKWCYADDEAFPLDESIPPVMLNAVCHIVASGVAQPDGSEDFGFDDPECIISLYRGETKTAEFTVGDRNDFTGKYFLSKNGDETVYVVDAETVAPFSGGLYSIVKQEELPNINTIIMYTVTTAGKTATVEYLPDDAEEINGDEAEYFRRLPDGSPEALDADTAQRAMDKLYILSWGGCVDYNANDESLENYGLGEEPMHRVDICYPPTVSGTGEGKEEREYLRLCIGTQTGDYYFARIDGSRMVYIIDKAVYDDLAAAAGIEAETKS